MKKLHKLMMTGILAFALPGFAATEWEPTLIENGNFANGTAAAADGWSAGFFDGAQGTVTRISGDDKERPNQMELKFNQPAKGMIQLQSKPFRLPTDGPRRFRLVTQHRGAGLVQIRFYAVEQGKGLTWLKRADGSPVQLEQSLKPGSDWQKTVSEWTLSKERLAQNIFANVTIMFWASKSDLKVSSIELQFEKPAAPAPAPAAPAARQ